MQHACVDTEAVIQQWAVGQLLSPTPCNNVLTGPFLPSITHPGISPHQNTYPDTCNNQQDYESSDALPACNQKIGNRIASK